MVGRPGAMLVSGSVILKHTLKWQESGHNLVLRLKIWNMNITFGGVSHFFKYKMGHEDCHQIDAHSKKERIIHLDMKWHKGHQLIISDCASKKCRKDWWAVMCGHKLAPGCQNHDQVCVDTKKSSSESSQKIIHQRVRVEEDGISVSQNCFQLPNRNASKSLQQSPTKTTLRGTSISELGKRNIIDSKVFWEGICWFSGRVTTILSNIIMLTTVPTILFFRCELFVFREGHSKGIFKTATFDAGPNTRRSSYQPRVSSSERVELWIVGWWNFWWTGGVRKFQQTPGTYPGRYKKTTCLWRFFVPCICIFAVFGVCSRGLLEYL